MPELSIAKIVWSIVSFVFVLSLLGGTLYLIKRYGSNLQNRAGKKVKIVADLNQKKATAYGQTIDLYIREDKKRLKATFFIKTRSGRRIPLSYVFLANGEVHSSISQQAGYKTTGGGIYKCSGWNGSL